MQIQRQMTYKKHNSNFENICLEDIVCYRKVLPQKSNYLTFYLRETIFFLKDSIAVEIPV